MASASFDGTTFWSDSGTGIGSVEITAEPARRDWSLVRLPRGVGYVAQDLGTEPGAIVASFQYSLTSSQLSSLQSQVAGFGSRVGQLTLPPGQSYGNCVLLRSAVQRGPATEPCGGGTTQYLCRLTMQFQRLG